MKRKIICVGIASMFLLTGLTALSVTGMKTGVEKCTIKPTTDISSLYTGRTIYVDDDNTEGPWYGSKEYPYQFIQDGIDAADDGDIVYVYSGTYYEEVVIGKSINLTGEDRNSTIIEGEVKIWYTCGVTVCGFTFSKSDRDSISVYYSPNIVITENTIVNNHDGGIFVYVSSNTIISGNIITENTGDDFITGIYAGYSSDITITGNTIVDNSADDHFAGISAYHLFDSIIIDNTITDNTGGRSALGIEIRGWRDNPLNYTIVKDNIIANNTGNIMKGGGSKGIEICDSAHNMITGNTITGHTGDTNLPLNCLCYGSGIYITYSHDNIISGNIIANNNVAGINQYCGPDIILHDNSATIFENTITGSLCGILQVEGITDNTISKNVITNNFVGIHLGWIKGSAYYECNETIVKENTITDNTWYGIESCPTSKNNHFYHNNFKDNNKNAVDYGITNTWYNTALKEGNYWDDYIGNDDDGDGIGDASYGIEPHPRINKDKYPLMNPYGSNRPPNKPNKPSGPSSGEAGTEYEYTTSTTDPNGDDISYWFDWGDGSNSGWTEFVTSGTEGSASHTWTEEGNYQIRVKAKDVHGAESPWSDPLLATMPVSEGVNQLPVADAGGPYAGDADESIQFHGSGSSDPDGTIVSYEWDFGDGETGSGINPIHSYNNGGIYTVTLTVTDNDGATATDTASIDINVPPEIYIYVHGPLGFYLGPYFFYPQPNQYDLEFYGDVGVDYTFKATHPLLHPLWPDTNDPDGDISRYKWERETGGSCFLAGTKVTMADGTYKNIEDVELGDMVKAYDETNKRVTNSKVVTLFYHTPQEMTDFYMVINGKLRVTPNHRMYINNEWQAASTIQVADILQDIKGGKVVASSVEKVCEKVPTYNLEVETYHTYYAEDILVHNAKGQPQYPWVQGSEVSPKTWSWNSPSDSDGYKVTLSVKDDKGTIRSATVTMHITESGGSAD
jgi:parallel beta-helix repeat protein